MICWLMGGWHLDDVRGLDPDYYHALLKLIREGKIRPAGMGLG